MNGDGRRGGRRGGGGVEGDSGGIGLLPSRGRQRESRRGGEGASPNTPIPKSNSEKNRGTPRGSSDFNKAGPTTAKERKGTRPCSDCSMRRAATDMSDLWANDNVEVESPLRERDEGTGE